MRARAVIGATALAVLASACSATPNAEIVTIVQPPAAVPAPQELDWRPWFSDLSHGAILVRLDARRLSYWSPDGQAYREFPIAIAEAAEYERTGVTEIVRRREQPDWRPTPSMLERKPDLPPYVAPGPENPMGEHALYLGWEYYAIHGTNDPASIGRATTSGCIRLFPEHIAWLFEHAGNGTPVAVVHESSVSAEMLAHLEQTAS